MNEKCEGPGITCKHLSVKAHELGLYEECELNRCMYEKKFTDIDRQKLEMWDEMVKCIVESYTIYSKIYYGYHMDHIEDILDRAKKIQEAGE